VSAAPLGAVVRLFYDPAAGGPPVLAGDDLVTTTGRSYHVLSATQQRRGRVLGRVNLVCIVQRAPLGPGRMHPLRWYRRDRRRE
jgi:hypothetical protein